MIDDPIAHAASIEREVRSTSREGTPTKTVIARRTFSTGRDEVWEAVTSPARIPQWFLPVSGDLRVGGRYQLEGNAGGVIESCDAPTSFAVTWEFDEAVSWLTVALTGTGDGTVLELAHEGPIDPMWEEYGPGAGGVGWDLGLLGLGLHLDSRTAVDPETAAAFTFSPEGIEFVRLSAAGWADAAVRDGQEPESARAAAGRTAAIYTTAPDDGQG